MEWNITDITVDKFKNHLIFNYLFESDEEKKVNERTKGQFFISLNLLIDVFHS